MKKRKHKEYKMYLSASLISCGIKELCEVGCGNDEPSQREYDMIMNDWPAKAIVIASLTSKQKNAIKFLLKNGFEMVRDKGRKWKINPNTRNKIALFVKYVNKRKKRR
jgi:hypothetical protein